MKVIGASEFKARCLALIDEVGQTGTSVVITKRGRQVAQLVPYSDVGEAVPQETLRGTVSISADIEEPVTAADDWDAIASREE